MTEKEINIAIAEACGYYYGRTVDDPLFGCWRTPSGKRTSAGCVPDYCHDLNAMHGAMAVLTDIQRKKFVVTLDGICGPWRWDTINADALQRAEAFLRTIGKWRD